MLIALALFIVECREARSVKLTFWQEKPSSKTEKADPLLDLIR